MSECYFSGKVKKEKKKAVQNIMNVFYNNEQLLNLISSIHELTGIFINIHELSGKDIRIRDAHTAFCRTINDLPEGHIRCVNCDAEASEICKEIKTAYHYRCHAGLCETLIPILDKGEVISYLGFGQLLDESPIEEQWAYTESTLGWYPDDIEDLKEKFFQIRQYSHPKTTALTEVLKVMASYVQSSNTVTSTKYTDLQRLEMYLSQHYAEKLSIQSLTKALNFGTTKLSALSKTLSGGHTLTWLIASHRVQAAQKLLLSTDKPISEIASIVGYEDYNYFTKVFKSIVGTTPSNFRKTGTT